jgi:hypothetical protein
LGVAVGIALLNKQLVLPLLLALLVGVVANHPWSGVLWRLRSGDGAQRLLGPLLALLIALLICAPSLLWQTDHGWPELRVARVLSHVDGVSGRLLFLPLQLLELSPVLVPVAAVGLRTLLREDGLRWARPVALAYPVLCALVLLGGGKPYYPLPVLLALTAAGCEPVVRWARNFWRILAPLALAAVTSALVALPVLPVAAVTVTNAVDIDQGEQVGWPEFTRATAAAWAGIPSAQRAHGVLLTSNYGEAGALAHYGPGYGLPTAYSGHMSLYDWGPPPDLDDGPVLIVEQNDGHTLVQKFTGCRTVGRIDNGHGISNQEQHAQLVLCEGAHQRWSVLWPSLRQY